jgi:single-stranded-DNA-specific exonuclease
VVSDLPDQRWHIAPAQPEQAEFLAQSLHLPPLLTQILLNRGLETPAQAQVFLEPERQILPSPLEEFEDLPIALELLLRAIAERQYIAICGDYDADGMTSTALLLRALRYLGAQVDYAIPSRMQEGYGINRRIVEEFHQEGVGLILTVDNGIAAQDPIAYARELGLAVIVTDHHDIPPTLPPANAILNPKLIREDSPYRGVAGVGVAYILAVCLAQSLQKTQDLTTPLIELFTLGTIADLAPLTGVNRRWVKRGLKLLPKSRMSGVQALIQVAGLSHETNLKPEAIGFRLGPRINAIGRISDPQIVIELLTTDEDGRALELAMKCEQVNQLRQRLCELIEQEAVAWCLETQFDPQQSRVLVIVQPGWHHGVIGIVASRLVERYGVPVFIGSYEDEPDEVNQGEAAGEEDQATGEAAEPPAKPAASPKIRGSARGIPEFDVFEALSFCDDLLDRYGGHRAAGGFTFAVENLEAVRQRLGEFAQQTLRLEHLKPLVRVDVQAHFRDLSLELFGQMDVLHPCGIENPDPVFWTPQVQIVEQRQIGQNQAHLKLTVAEVADPSYSFKAVAWRWGSYYPLPNRVDIAYRLRLNEWNGVRSVELELVGVRPVQGGSWLAQNSGQERLPAVALELAKESSSLAAPVASPAAPIPGRLRSAALLNSFNLKLPSVVANAAQREPAAERDLGEPTERPAATSLEASIQEGLNCFEINSVYNPAPLTHPALLTSEQAASKIEFYYSKRKYSGGVYQDVTGRELRIQNDEGHLLVIQPERRRGFLGHSPETLQEIDVSQPHYFNLVRSALTALELVEKQQQLQEKERQIVQLTRQLQDLQQQMLQLQSLVVAAEPILPGPVMTDPEVGQPAVIEPNGLPEPGLPEPGLPEPGLIEPGLIEPEPPVLPNLSDDPKQWLRVKLGESAWSSLDSRSQKDLLAAYKKYVALDPAGLESADYSDIGLRLCSVIEREVIQPFFRELHQFLLENEEPCEIGGVALRARKKYTLGMLPPLLAAQWQTFQEDALTDSEPATDQLYTIITASLSSSDRETVEVFLTQWEQPLARWLEQSTAASEIAQIDKLLTLAADADSLLYCWQFQRLQTLVMGDTEQAGILRQIHQ